MQKILTLLNAIVAFACTSNASSLSENVLHECVREDNEECVMLSDSSCIVKEEKGVEEEETPFVLKENASLLDYLNPDILENAELMSDISKSLQLDELVVVRDAFLPEFAEYVWRDLNREDLEWPLNSDSFEGGFSFSHHNIYDPEVRK